LFTACVYHNADLDGFCSAAIVKNKYPDCDLIGLDYGHDIPWSRLENQDVVIVDFSFQPWSEMEKLRSIAKTLTWIDHHKSAITASVEAGSPSITGLRDVHAAACELTWEYVYTGHVTPLGVFLLSDYDCWRHSHPQTMTYQMGMRMLDMDPVSPGAMSRWALVFANDEHFRASVISRGHVILEYQRQQDAKSVKATWFPVEFDGKKWMAVNRGGISSQFWDSVWDADYAGKLGFVRSRKHWTITLYSDTVDCGDIAKRYGGGGHAGAAGFQCAQLPFLLA
jgi:uncharacterized protein